MLIPVDHKVLADGLFSEFFQDEDTADVYAIAQFPGKPDDFFPLRLDKHSGDFQVITVPGHEESCYVFDTRDKAHQFLVTRTADFI